MPVALEFINVLIRRDAIDEKIEGGWEGFIENHASLDTIDWHDEYLFRTGAMSPDHICLIIDGLKELGLIATKKENGEEVWADLCVFENLFGTDLQCSWLDKEYWMKNPMKRAIRFLGDDSEFIAGRGSDDS